MIEHAEWFLANAAQWLKLVIESIGILVAFGVCVTVVNLVRPAGRAQWSGSFTWVRFDLAAIWPWAWSSSWPPTWFPPPSRRLNLQ